MIINNNSSKKITCKFHNVAFDYLLLLILFVLLPLHCCYLLEFDNLQPFLIDHNYLLLHRHKSFVLFFYDFHLHCLHLHQQVKTLLFFLFLLQLFLHQFPILDFNILIIRDNLINISHILYDFSIFLFQDVFSLFLPIYFQNFVS